ncbi:MAG: hypothetical protein P4L84_06970 [Isosphaeraceae bacterium]|nr:hypothetical protein [Isosphaeraceae bacterium]
MAEIASSNDGHAGIKRGTERRRVTRNGVRSERTIGIAPFFGCGLRFPVPS